MAYRHTARAVLRRWGALRPRAAPRRDALRRAPSGSPLEQSQSGQALTEFVIVLPLFLLVIIFCMWLWEIGHVRLKLVEAARFAAWEATAYKLHDYGEDARKAGLGALLDESSLGGLSSSFGKLSSGAVGGAIVDHFDLGSGSHFNRMRGAVMASAFLKYANLDSSRMGMQTGRMTASWDRPKIWIPDDCGAIIGTVATLAGAGSLCGNQSEELIYGGQLVNMIAKLAAVGFAVTRAMSFTNLNPIAHSLIALGFDTEFSGFAMPGEASGDGAIPYGGAGGAIVSGLPHWNFNSNGYVVAYASTTVKNEWFNLRIFGKPLFARRGVELTEYHGVLADSWRLNRPIGDDLNKGDKKLRNEDPKAKQEAALEEQRKNEAQNKAAEQQQNILEKAWGKAKGAYSWAQGQKDTLMAKADPRNWWGGAVDDATYGGAERGAYWNQVNRLYFASPLAQRTANSFIMLFKQVADMALLKIPAVTALATGLTDDDFFYPTIAVQRYGYDDKDKRVIGRHEMDEDGRTGHYHTLPFREVHKKTLEARGRHYDGCKDEESMGCLPSLASDRLWGSGIMRP